jgi:ankyrin repeat protein
MLDLLPRSILQHVVTELKSLTESSEMSDQQRAHAAMILSECYALGFGAAHDSEQVIGWVYQAALLGQPKAINCYHRICFALELQATAHDKCRSIQGLEDKLTSLSSQEYLKCRVQGLAKLQMEEAKKDLESSNEKNPEIANICRYKLAFFNSWHVDEVLPLHLAAWMGDKDKIVALLASSPVDTQSSNGFGAVHYACFGGQLTTLTELLDNKASGHQIAFAGISPLHLTIFFDDDDLISAVALLLEHGASPQAKSSKITWDNHDIVLSGTPLDWAVLTRNRTMVEALLPHTQQSNCLSIAISHYFWEIVDLLIPHFHKSKSLDPRTMFSLTIQRPFSHWIAHGRDHVHAIRKTLEICNNHQLLHKTDEDDNSPLRSAINSARAEDDFKLVEIMISLSSDVQVKQIGDNGGFTALLSAIGRARHNGVWLRPLKAIVARYTVEELERKALDDIAASFLHFAVTSDSVVGAQALLERGVDVNQPTFDEAAETPLQLCMLISSSTEMYSLLAQYAAAKDLRDQAVGKNHIRSGLFKLHSNDKLINLALHSLDGDEMEELYVSTLRGMLLSWIGSKETYRSDIRDAFAYLLATPEVGSYINRPDRYGATILHLAAKHPHVDSVKMLLEAGASADISLKLGDSDVFPLQVACAAGRLFRLNTIHGWRKDIPEEQWEGFLPVAEKLLEWHHARASNNFRGITPLHLALHIGCPTKIEELSKSRDSQEKGNWPNLEHEVTPAELARAELRDDVVALDLVGLTDNSGPSGPNVPA